MDRQETLASEIYAELKRKCKRRERAIIFLLILVCVLTLALGATMAKSMRGSDSGHVIGNPGVVKVNLKSEFTEPECQRFRQLCNFTPEERQVFDLRVKGMSIVEIQMNTCMSESTVNRRIRSIKKKIYKVL